MLDVLNKNFIVIWRFEDAPEELQALSDHGGDEDWVALVPPNLKDEYIGWMDEGTSYSNSSDSSTSLDSSSFDDCADVSEYECPDLPGYVVRIGSHG
jgi:hypothetical protein